MTTYFSPLVMLLLRWTLLFALAWGIHFILRNRHARWRQMLWRGVLLSVATIALMPLLPVPLVQISVGRSRIEALRPLPSDPLPAPAAKSSGFAALPEKSPAVPVTAAFSPAIDRQSGKLPFTLTQMLLILWAASACSPASFAWRCFISAFAAWSVPPNPRLRT